MTTSPIYIALVRCTRCNTIVERHDGTLDELYAITGVSTRVRSQPCLKVDPRTGKLTNHPGWFFRLSPTYQKEQHVFVGESTITGGIEAVASSVTVHTGEERVADIAAGAGSSTVSLAGKRLHAAAAPVHPAAATVSMTAKRYHPAAFAVSAQAAHVSATGLRLRGATATVVAGAPAVQVGTSHIHPAVATPQAAAASSFLRDYLSADLLAVANSVVVVIEGDHIFVPAADVASDPSTTGIDASQINDINTDMLSSRSVVVVTALLKHTGFGEANSGRSTTTAAATKILGSLAGTSGRLIAVSGAAHTSIAGIIV